MDKNPGLSTSGSTGLKEAFPPFHRVRSRPRNPLLYEHAKKEFERLTWYM